VSEEATPLTGMARGAGCGCKLGQGLLAEALSAMPALADPNVIVGLEGLDDAAVYRVRDDLAVVASVDFFTPIVDDPATFGRIAATNALSDLHAMGATPAFGLAVAAYPRDADTAVLAAILRGGAEAAAAEGCPVLGGHTVDDPEPKYGLAVVGLADPAKLLTVDRAQPGDHLVLTKPVGTGVVATALKRGAADPADVAAAVASMTTLNAAAAEVAVAAGVRAATDVTGYGLLGHLHRMLRASGVAGEVHAARVPFLPGAAELAAAGHISGGTRANETALRAHVALEAGLPPVVATLLHDAQTSGGLLLAVPGDALAGLVAGLRGRGVEPALVGRVLTGQAGSLRVRRMPPD
jgi:selenide, water dikinase